MIYNTIGTKFLMVFFYCAGTGELMSEIVKSAANLGIAAVLLFIFVEAFLKFYQ